MGLKGNQFGDLSSLTALQILNLSNNVGLKGTLPSSIGNLKNLTTIILVGCSFFGPIPESISSLHQLVYMYYKTSLLLSVACFCFWYNKSDY
ncbi:putative leucine-rich repeat receptor-like protein kinase [Nicotiana attenuata]|uniref:Leucine-rich repeat receptor-like protein kinase n=1 Tax=Nicotiana attenuata TaxID=49451 RepID=A0A1J6I8H2_NICAT|nr:putative leucine-rich repeat receptor-like protein kinase [Nicotiana attenuata]